MDRDREVSGRTVSGDARLDEQMVPPSDHGRQHMEVRVPT